MWCVIPAAGSGTRMGETLGSRPKALLTVKGTPLLGTLLLDVARVADDACIVIPPDDRSIPRVFGRRYGRMHLHYAIQEERRGVGHAVCAAAPVVDGPFAVTMGDAFFGDPLAPHLVSWRTGTSPGAVLVQPLDPPLRQPAGLVRVHDGRVQAIEKGEDPAGFTHRVGGVFMFPARAFSACGGLGVSSTGEIEIEGLVRALLSEGVEFRAVPYPGWRRNVNTPRDLAEVRRRAGERGPPER